MKVAQIGSTNTDTLSICLSDVHDTANMEPSPPDHLSGNYPEQVFHPRMNSRSEQYTLHCIRTPLTMHPPMSCICIALLPCIYCFSPLFLPIDVATTAGASPPWSTTTPTIVPLLSSFQASSAPSPLPDIAYLSIFIFALGIAAATLHSYSIA